MIRIAAVVVLFLALLSGLYGIYALGKQAGISETTVVWAAEKEAQRLVAEQLQAEYTALEDTNRKLTQENIDELQKAQGRYDALIAQYKSEYAARLLSSEERAGVYKRQAQGGAIERDHLASYAAELDRSLEQGRGLVRELRETLRQREVAIKSLATQIRLDRSLFSMSEPNGN